MDLKKDEAATSAEHLIDICLALSREKELTRLLDIIVSKARQLTHAEAGSLYMVEEEVLSFEVLQNAPMGIYYTRADAPDAPMPSVPLVKEGAPNESNVSACVANTGLPIHIEDLYDPAHREFSGVHAWDKSSGFKSVSMLALPLIGYKDEVVAVLQLINRKDSATGRITAFRASDINLMSAIASQAAVAIVKVKLIKDLQALLFSFVKAIAWAVDAKSPVTGEHINRVVGLTMKIARLVNESDDQPFRDIRFDDDKMEELRYAAWMHDVGKIITPGRLIEKATKLERLTDGISVIKQRFETIKLSLIFKGGGAESKPDTEKALEAVDRDFDFLTRCNETSFLMDEAALSRLESIRKKTFQTWDNSPRPWITEDEYQALRVKKGNLTIEERKQIQNHALMSRKILDNIQFPKHLENIPLYASSHHEKPNGTGYPQGLAGDDLPIQARIMAIADVYEALTAKDRPYKKCMTPAQAEAILSRMKDRNEIDEDLFDLCRRAGVFKQIPE